jgi:hypothetical protein
MLNYKRYFSKRIYFLFSFLINGVGRLNNCGQAKDARGKSKGRHTNRDKPESKNISPKDCVLISLHWGAMNISLRMVGMLE